MNNGEKQITLGRWTKATFLGWLLGVALILVLSSVLDSTGIEHLQFHLGVGMGAGVGFAQWLLLKKRAAMSKNWIWFSILGMGIPFIILDLMPAEMAPHKIAAGIVSGALATGLLQYQLLKKQFRNAQLWIYGCFTGWTLAVATVFAIDYTKYLTSSNLVLFFLNLFLMLAGGIVLGAISGFALKRIYSNHSPGET